MVILSCAIVRKGKAFKVDIDDNASVSALRDAIKAKNTTTITCDAKDLQLFLATMKDGTWLGLDEAGAASVDLDQDGDAQHLNTKLVKMKSLQRLNKCVGKLPVQGQVHVLVVVPEPLPKKKDARYFIRPEAREKVTKAAFVIVEEIKDDKGVGMGVFNGVGIGVFFTATLAVTCDHNLTEQNTVGSSVSLALKDEMVDVVVVARNAELDFAILKSSKPRSFIAPWNGRTDDLELRSDLVLASFRLGINEYQELYKGKLGFAPAACIVISSHGRHIMFSCPTYAGDSGAALIVIDGCLVGIHQVTINVLREVIGRKKLIKDRLNDVEESLDNMARSRLVQGCLGLLVHEFKDVVSE
ncbi:Crinkler (CRN) [Phytophthora megakarya]|uniref:Crinkler (CRN) n=1 Tax=Phytophthora megakarya TaxID=4795 RepID=A0A225V2S0_9STRA|nr:Crinkler (CRN) [Phytophthora megakarya]